jgi:glutamate N-acetyltransferase/amino-acid N-acetyltransferase
MSKQYTSCPNGICAAQGFTAAAASSGIRKSGKLDLALIVSSVPATAAGVFTRNKIKAAPLIVSQNHVKDGKLQAIIVNSGNANACTGTHGLMAARQMTHQVAQALKINHKLVAVASTGVIGQPLPIEKIIPTIPSLAQQLSATHSLDAATAIRTTDTYAKQHALKFKLEGKEVTLGAIAKGSGMIHPNMATMLAFITSDVAIAPLALQAALRVATNNSFNMISVDGDSSTNDMVLLLANGLAGNQLIDSTSHPLWPKFLQALQTLCIELAKQIAADGEGATKLLETQVTGALNDKQARAVAKEVISSNLVKAAMFGNDANWGRIACAIGNSGTKINPQVLSIHLGSLCLFQNGVPLEFDEAEALSILQRPTVTIYIDLGLGAFTATAWGCDLSYDYVKINAAYRT